MASIRLEQRPRLSTQTRLQYDSASQSCSLHSPERILRLNPSATEIVQRCTGELTVHEIIDELLDTYALQHALGGGVSATQVTADVLSLLRTLTQRQLLTVEPFEQ